ncbi:MAG: mevalonate kinase [Deltaproteobacteria bacterium]|nr:mevalonate kinase [Deltaproteobacteria bacterium]
MRRAVSDAAHRGGHGRAIGKAIVVGEHFVVHGSPAIAVPVRGRHVEVVIGARTLATARRHPESERARSAIVAMLDELGVPENALSEVALEVGGDLPLGAGLGGSAAVAAALGRALGVSAADLPDFVHRMERLAHGKPSGVDGAVVCAERAVWFQVTDEGPQMRWLDGEDGRAAAADLPLWIAIVPRMGSTKDAVARVGAFREAEPATFSRLAAAAREDALAARDALAAGDLADLATMGAIFDRAQARLETVGVSTPALAALVAAARAQGAYGAKLSGAGLGGAVLAVAPPGVDLGPALVAAGATDVIPPIGRFGRGGPGEQHEQGEAGLRETESA